MKLAELKAKFKNKYMIRIVSGVLVVALVGGGVSVSVVQAAKNEKTEIATENVGAEHSESETAKKGAEDEKEDVAGEKGNVKERLEDAINQSITQNEKKIGKEETVYIIADSNGNAKETIVSDHLLNAENKKTLADVSSLKDIKNVKGDESFTQDGNKLTWQADGNDIYYQGTSDRKIPVTQKITYYLDGKEIAPADLTGKSGKVTIRFDYTNNEKTGDVFVPFMAVSGMVLDDSFDNIEVTNGKVIADGKNNMVVGYTLPGLKESLDVNEDDFDSKISIPDYFEIKADVENFELGMTMTAVVNAADFIGAERTEGADSIQEMLDSLTDATDQLADGSATLAEGMDTLQSKMGEFSDGVHTLRDGIKKYTDGAAQLAGGIGTLKDGVGTLTENVPALTDGVKQLKDGSKSAADGAAALKAGTGELESGAVSLLEGANTLSGKGAELSAGAAQVAGGAEQLANGIDTLAAGIGQVQAGVNSIPGTLGAGLDAQIANLQATAGGVGYNGLTQKLTEMQAQRTALVGQINAAIAVVNDTGAGDAAKIAAAQQLCQAVIGLQQLDEGIQQIQGGISQVDGAVTALTGVKGQLTAPDTFADLTNGLQQLADGAAGLQQGAAGLKTGSAGLSSAAEQYVGGVNTLSAGAKKLADGAGQVAAGTTSLSNGLNTLDAGLGELNSKTGTLAAGAKQLSDGTKQLADGAATLTANSAALNDGAAKLQDGAGALSAGVGALSDGAHELADGVVTFNEEGIEKILNAYNGDIEPLTEKIQAVLDAGADYQTYTGIADGVNGSVKFLYRTEA